MHSFVIKNIDLTSAHFSNHPDVLIIRPDTSIGVEEVRQIQTFLSKKPLQAKLNTVYLDQAHLLTIPAQNALLKILEEPPAQSQIYLVTAFVDQLLPTVLSRVQIEPQGEAKEKPDTTKSKLLLDKLLKAKVGERLVILDEQGFTRESLTTLLDQLEWIMHEQIQQGDSPALHHNFLIQARKYLKANCNLKLVLNFIAVKL